MTAERGRGGGGPRAGPPASGHESGDGSVAGALAWLEPRLQRVPEELAERVRAVVGRADPGPAPDLLASAAVEELERLTEAPQDRNAAIRLLAADAALTWAFEAAAELGADVPELADATGLPGRIGELLRAREPRSGGANP